MHLQIFIFYLHLTLFDNFEIVVPEKYVQICRNVSVSHCTLNIAGENLKAFANVAYFWDTGEFELKYTLPFKRAVRKA